MKTLEPISSNRFYKSKSKLRTYTIGVDLDGYYVVSGNSKRKIKTIESSPYQTGNCFYVAIETLGGIRIGEKFHSYA